MMRIRHRIDDRQARAAFTRAPEVMERAIAVPLEQGAKAIAVTARRNASRYDAFGGNREQIRVEKVSNLHFRVIADSAYARPLEEGTGPAVGRRMYMPDPETLEQYIKKRAGIRWGRAGSRKRRSQEREIRDRAWGLALHILFHGTKPHPFMAPAAEEHRSELHRNVERGVWLGIAEVFGP